MSDMECTVAESTPEGPAQSQWQRVTNMFTGAVEDI